MRGEGAENKKFAIVLVVKNKKINFVGLSLSIAALKS